MTSHSVLLGRGIENKYCHDRLGNESVRYIAEKYWGGLRLGEMLALTLNDIDLENGIISVTKTYNHLNGEDIISTPKTPSSVRKVSMPAFLCEV